MATSKTESGAAGEGTGSSTAETAARTGESGPASRRERRRANAQRPRTPLNVIAPAATLQQRPEEAARRPAMGGTPRADNALGAPLDTQTMPAYVRDRYVQDGRDYYLRSGERAFVDNGSRLTTRSENTTIVRDLVAVAAARGWSEVVVAGSKAFRHEAWREARLAGLDVSGYTASRAEQALLIDALARRQAESRSAGPSPDSPGSESQRRADSRDSPLITGKLLAHGPGLDPNTPEPRASYYVLVKTPRGERELWGADLERAIRQSLTDVQLGDEIGLRAVERRATRPKSRSPDAAPAPEDSRGEAPRDGWIVEQRRFFNDRAQLAKVFRDASVRPSDGYRKHPELKGSYLELQAAKLRIEQSVPHPEDRTAFLAQLRERMAAAMERGEPLTPVRLRERPKTAEIPDPQQLVR